MTNESLGYYTAAKALAKSEMPTNHHGMAESPTKKELTPEQLRREKLIPMTSDIIK